MTDEDENEEVKPEVKKKVAKIKKRLLKKEHSHAGTIYPVGTPLENLKASDSTIEFLEKRNII